MSNALRTIVHEYGWIHLSIGILGNLTFFVGSIFFLPALSETIKTAGVWLFIAGSFLMMVGAAGEFAAKLFARTERRREAAAR